jgi:sterol 3beta-glucosyltransferase
VPFSHDQPDNGWRVHQLGIARMLTRKQYKAASVAKEIGALLSDPAVARRAEAIGAIVRNEDGARRASELIETMLAKTAAPRDERKELIYATGD